MTPREYRDRLAFEHDLINRRLTWLITSQTILFAAAGLALEKKNAGLAVGTAGPEVELLKIIAICGAVIASLILVSIVAALLAKTSVWNDYRDQQGRECEPFGARTGITVVAFLPDILLPIVFMVAWWCVYWIFTKEHFSLWYGLPAALGLLCLVVVAFREIRKHRKKK